MPRRLFLALLLLVAAPMVLLGWMSASAVKASQAAAKENLANLLSSQLYEVDQQISRVFAGYADLIDSELDSAASITETLRRLRREVPIVRQGIMVDPSGVMVFPLASDSVGIDAVEVAASIPGMIDARPMQNRDPDSDRLEPGEGNPLAVEESKAWQQPEPLQEPETKQQIQSTPDQQIQPPPQKGTTRRTDQLPPLRPVNFAFGKIDPAVQRDRPESAWQQWYMADGAQVIYWQIQPNGTSIGILLERSRWIADLIAVLPDDRRTFDPSLLRSTQTGSSRESNEFVSTGIGSVALVDESKRPIYRWGTQGDFKLPPLTVTDLSSPLASWQLRLHVNDSLLPDSSPVPMYLSLSGIGLTLLAVGFYVLTTVQRQIADAKSRVSFAGQVSHELRTPLTNIRLYTELAESDLKCLDESQASRSLAKRLEVIDHESRRLHRLVSGVLEMIRPSGKHVGLRRLPTDICQLLAGITDQFQPSFEAAGLTLESSCEIAQDLWIDADIVEMVLVNLLSNVEKYVPRGGRCSIKCDVVGDRKTGAGRLRVLIEDDGPGIATVNRSKIFRPFVRLDDSVSAPSGTGIGLTIARRAALRHDGDLVLLTTSTLGGAAFQLSLPIDDET